MIPSQQLVSYITKETNFTKGKGTENESSKKRGRALTNSVKWIIQHYYYIVVLGQFTAHQFSLKKIAVLYVTTVLYIVAPIMKNDLFKKW